MQWVDLWLATLAFALVAILPAPLSAQDGGAEGTSSPPAVSKTGVALWMFQDDRLSGEQRTRFREGLNEALSDAQRRHLLTSSAFRDYLGERAATVAPCLKGLKPCISPTSLAFRQLGLTALVRVDITPVDDETLEAAYELVDHRGEVAQQASVSGTDARALAFTLARDLFDATGTVTVETTPSGAAVRIDGQVVGTTPIETRLPIGTHTYTLQHPGHRNIEGSFELGSGTAETIQHELEKRPGTVLIQNAPDGATVHVDDQKLGPTGKRLDLEPGSYELEVRAEGFETYDESIAIESGEMLRRSVPLEHSSSLLSDVTADEIAVNNYVARLTLDQSLHPTSFRDARGSVGDRQYEFQGFADDSGGPPRGSSIQRLMAPRGLRLDLSYTRRHFGVIFFSLSYAATGTDRRAFVETAADEGIPARVTSIRRLQLRPLQVSYRRFFGNFVPSIEIGTGLTFQWITLDQLLEVERLTLNQTEAFWNLALNGQYFINDQWFGIVRYSLQDYFNRGKGLEHVFSLGVGGAFPNLFGFEPEPPEQL